MKFYADDTRLGTSLTQVTKYIDLYALLSQNTAKFSVKRKECVIYMLYVMKMIELQLKGLTVHHRAYKHDNWFVHYLEPILALNLEIYKGLKGVRGGSKGAFGFKNIK